MFSDSFQTEFPSRFPRHPFVTKRFKKKSFIPCVFALFLKIIDRYCFIIGLYSALYFFVELHFTYFSFSFNHSSTFSVVRWLVFLIICRISHEDKLEIKQLDCTRACKCDFLASFYIFHLGFLYISLRYSLSSMVTISGH